MHVTKMNGLGNDYIYYFGELENPAEVSIKVSDRHFGIGSDGLILIDKSEVADFKMRIFNADGSEAKMCGNGIRCVGKFVYDKGYTDKTNITVETLSGIRTLDLNVSNNKVESATVNMGKYKVDESVTLNINSDDITLIPVSVGNPHAVVFVPNADEVAVETLGKLIEHDSFFVDGVNVEFVQKLSDNTFRMRVWERGSGVTLACGTGACASVAAAVQTGRCPENEEITIKLDGGNLRIKAQPDCTLIMTGPAQTVCECEVEI